MRFRPAPRQQLGTGGIALLEQKSKTASSQRLGGGGLGSNLFQGHDVGNPRGLASTATTVESIRIRKAVRYYEDCQIMGECHCRLAKMNAADNH
jgi:hypothetical protein